MAAAEAEIARHGADASLEEIARRAGVGSATRSLLGGGLETGPPPDSTCEAMLVRAGGEDPGC